MIIPRPVYELLPVLYVIAGIAAITTVDSIMSFVSGILLGISGIVVMVLRRNYRAAQKAYQQEDGEFSTVLF